MIFSTSPLPVLACDGRPWRSWPNFNSGFIYQHSSLLSRRLPPTSSMPMISPRCKNRVLADCRGRPPFQPHWSFCRQVHRKILPKCVKNIHLCQKMLNGEQEMANTSKFWMYFWSNFLQWLYCLLSKGWDMEERHCSTQISLIRSNDEAKTETL